MQLRSGTTIIISTQKTKTNKKTTNKKTETNTPNIDSCLTKIRELMNINENCEKTIENMKYMKQLYNILDDEFFLVYKNMSHKSMVKFIMVLYKKSLSLTCDIIKKTYELKSLEYTSSEKEMMVTLLYKLHQVFIKTRAVMTDLIDSSDYMKTLLKTSEENKGKIIEDRNSKEALAYYCYSHLYNSNEINEYDIYTYEDGEYTYEEIYDYYYGNNTNNNPEDDKFLREYYSRWFTDENNISHYNKGGYKRHTELYNYEELRARIEYHREELNKYMEIMETLMI